MEKHFLQFTQWIKTYQLDTAEKQNLFKEVVRRARTHESTIPSSQWYRNVSIKFLPLSLATLSAIILVIYNITPTSPVVTTPQILDVHDPEYQVLSAYEQVDKITKEKASLKKIIQNLPPETIQANVAKELKTLETLITTDSPTLTTNTPSDTETLTKLENTKKPIISELVTTSTVLKTSETKTSQDATTNQDLAKTLSEKNLNTTPNVLKDYYEKIQTYEKSGNYTDALILIGEVKKLIKETNESTLPEIQKTIENKKQ